MDVGVMGITFKVSFPVLQRTLDVNWRELNAVTF